MRVRIPAVVASIALMLGMFAATTPAVAAPGCPAYNVCLYQNANFTGHYVFISNGSGTPDYRVLTWDDYPSQSVNDRVSSVINNGTGWFYAYRDINYAGPWRE